MKFLLIIFCFLSLHLSATDYYVAVTASGTGSGTSEANAMSYTTFLTTTVQNALTVGDNVYFKKGNIFYLYNYTTGVNNGKRGPVPRKSGVNYGAFGTGTAPKFSGFAAFVGSAFTTLSGSVKYVSLPLDSVSYSQLVSRAAVVMIKPSGGAWTEYAVGRWPNRPTYYDAVYQTSFARTKIGSNYLKSANGSPSFLNGEVVHRTYDYLWSRGVISAHDQTNGVITFSGFGADVRNGKGFFIQHHVNALDQYGDWAYDRTAQRLYVHGLQSTDSIKISAVQRLFDFNGSNTITVDGLDFEGAFENALNYGISSGITVKNFSLTHSYTGISGSTITNCNFINGFIAYNAARAVWFSAEGQNNNTITGCRFLKNGIVPGHGANSYNGYTNIQLQGNGNVFTYNKIDSVGGHAIVFKGSNNVIEKNLINWTQMVTEDAGAIASGYTVAAPSDTTSIVKQSNTFIQKNIILGGAQSSLEGLGSGNTRTASYQVGIYTDDNSHGNIIQNNVIAFSGYMGIYLHTNQNVLVRNNLSIMNGQSPGTAGQGFSMTAESLNAQRLKAYDLRVFNNIFVIRSNFSYSASYIARTNQAGASSWQIDSNTYYKLGGNTSGQIQVLNPPATTVTNYSSLSTFKTAYPAFEVNGKVGPTGLSTLATDTFFRYNASDVPIAVAANWYFKDMTGRQQAPTAVIVPPWGAVFGVKVSTQPTDQTAPTPGNGGVLTASSISQTGLTLNWTAATDASSITEYRVYASDAVNMSNLSLAQVNGTLLGTTTGTSLALTGLLPNTSRYYTVIARDAQANESVYSTYQFTTLSPADAQAPTPGGSGTLSVSDIGIYNFTVSWTKATDDFTPQGQIQYLVVKSASNNISSVTNAENNGIPVTDGYVTDISSALVTATPSTLTYVTVIAKDEIGNKSVYTATSATTDAEPLSAPSAPSAPTLDNVAAYEVLVSVPSVSGATLYRWYVSTTGSGGAYSLVSETATPSFTLSTQPTTTYHIKASAANVNDGDIQESAQSTASNAATTPAAPAPVMRYYMRNGRMLQRNGRTMTTASAEAVVPGRDFYLDPVNGNDANDGRTAATAWQTPAKVTTQSLITNFFKPGDNILLKAGESHHGPIRVEGIGTFQNPITVDRYGTGADPIILNDHTNAAWTAVPGVTGVYRGGFYGDLALATSGQVYDNNGVKYNQATRGTASLTTWLDTMSVGMWGQDVATLNTYVKPAGGVLPDTLYFTEFAAVKVYNTTSKHLIFQNLDLRNGFMGFYVWGDSCIIRNNNIQDFIQNGIHLEGSTGGANYTQVYNNTITRTGETSIYSQQSKRSHIHDNTISYTISTFLSHTIVTHRTPERCAVGMQQGFANLIEKNNISHTQKGAFDFYHESGSEILGNYVYMQGGPSNAFGNGIKMGNNIFNSDGGQGIGGTYGYNTTLNPLSTTDPVIIFNNTVRGATNYGLTIGSDNVIVKNNIIGIQGTANMVLIPAGVTTVNSSNNLFYHPSSTIKFHRNGTNYTTLSAWQAAWSPTTVENNSIVGDPLFVNPTAGTAAGLMVGSSSPANGAGLNLVTEGIIPAGTYYDYFGNLLPSVGAWPIGGHRYMP